MLALLAPASIAYRAQELNKSSAMSDTASQQCAELPHSISARLIGASRTFCTNNTPREVCSCWRALYACQRGQKHQALSGGWQLQGAAISLLAAHRTHHRSLFQLQSNAAAPLRPPPRPTRKQQRPQNRQATSLLGSATPIAPPISQSVAEMKAWVVFRRRPAETRPWAAA